MFAPKIKSLAKREVCFLNRERGRLSDCPKFSMDGNGLKGPKEFGVERELIPKLSAIFLEFTFSHGCDMDKIDSVEVVCENVSQ